MGIKISANAPCPCHSGRKYKRCCAPLHRGHLASSPGALMRSRYAAYALGIVPYIIATTDPAGPMWEDDLPRWRESIRAFSSEMNFQGLRITEETIAGDGTGDEGYVTFSARLSQGSHDASFSERSRFTKVDGGWRYHSGTPERAEAEVAVEAETTPH